MSVQWSLANTNRKRKKINLQPDYQRPAVWSVAQKQLLIDTFLRGYDVPKIYLDKNRTPGYEFDVVDGQQRLTAIFGFFADEYSLDEKSEPVMVDTGDGIKKYDIAGKKYSDLDDALLDYFNDIQIDVVIIDGKSIDEVTEMFLRMQNGTSLKNQEKRNAMMGDVRNYVKKIAKHKFFKCVSFNNTRYAHDEVAAQMLCLSLKGNITNIKDKDLNEMYKCYKSYNTNSIEAKKVITVLNYLAKVFTEVTPELNKTNVISLYILIMQLMDNYDITGKEKNIKKWFIKFEKNRNKMNDVEELDPELATYQLKIKNATATMDSLKYRHDYLKESLLSEIDLIPKDPHRLFDEAQRKVIYRNGNGICANCRQKCTWDAWEADHIVPWARGGKTVINNGQILCIDCHKAKTAKMISTSSSTSVRKAVAKSESVRKPATKSKSVRKPAAKSKAAKSTRVSKKK